MDHNKDFRQTRQPLDRSCAFNGGYLPIVVARDLRVRSSFVSNVIKAYGRRGSEGKTTIQTECLVVKMYRRDIRQNVIND